MLAAADPVNLHGITDEAPRAPVPNRRLAFRNGVAVAAKAGGNAVEWLAELGARRAQPCREFVSVGSDKAGYGAQASGGVWRRR